MDVKQIRESSIDELNEQLIELRKEQFNLRMQEATGQMVNSSEYRKVRRNIARIKTVMNEQRK